MTPIGAGLHNRIASLTMIYPPPRMPRRKSSQQPLAAIKTNIQLPVDVIARVQALAGPRGVSAFLREAVLEKLERQTGVRKPAE